MTMQAMADERLTQPPAERRARSDRRAHSDGGRRGKRRRGTIFGAVWRDIAAAVLLVVTMAYAITMVRPIFAGRQPVVAKLLPAAATAPADSTYDEKLAASPEFQRDRAAFAADLARGGRMPQGRADSIAYYAVREAYRRGIPPAVMFGVMLTENAVFASTATSNVGAVGLMQIYPKVWLKALGTKLGTDLKTDSTNVKYGAFILSEYIKPKKNADSVTAADVRTGLLRYNGCVRGSNTPNCHTYPDKVKKYVESQGSSLCGNQGFYDCIAKPILTGLFGEQVASR